MSLYADYIKERESKEILETEYGFAIYQIVPGDHVYIQDIYVVPEERKSGVAKTLADIIAHKAKLQDCTKMYGSVDDRANGSEDSEKVLLAYGMKPSHEDLAQGLKFYFKEI